MAGSTGRLGFGIFELDRERGVLFRKGEEVRLQPQPMAILIALVNRAGQDVTREELKGQVWPEDTFVELESAIGTAIRKIRQALGDSAENPIFIRTLHRRGYRFIAPVHRVAPLAEADLVREPGPAVPSPPPPSEPRRSRRRRFWVTTAVAAAAVCAVATAIVFAGRSRSANPAPTVRFAIDLPPSQEFKFYAGRHIGISPDGHTIAYIATSGGVRQIFIRKLDEAEFRPLAGTENATSLCFSPDGDWIAFMQDSGEIRKSSVDGRWNQKIVSLGTKSSSAAMAWARDGGLYFSADRYPGLQPELRDMFRVPGGGGKPEPVLPGPQPPDTAHYPQQVLGEGRGLLFSTDWSPGDFSVNVWSFRNHRYRQLIEHASGGRYLPTGQMLFTRSGNVMAVPFDIDAMETRGKPVIVVPDVAPDRYAGLQMDISETGTLVYFRSTIVKERQPVWVDMEGRESPANLPTGRYHLLDLSPDGRRLLLTRFEAGERWTVYWFQVDKPSWNEILSGDGPNTGAIWSPDERSIALAATYRGDLFDNLYLKPLETSGGERQLIPDAHAGRYPQSWSRAANAIAYTQGYSEKTMRDIYVLPLTPGAHPQCIVCTPANDIYPAFSPDGRWIAYTSGVSGRQEIYAQRYPGPSSPVRISPEGGENSLWSPSGRELYYRLGSDMWAIGFDPVPGRPGKARKLFSGRYDSSNSAWNRDMLLAPDGKRFLMLKVKDAPPDNRRIQVVLNWFSELKQAVQAGR